MMGSLRCVPEASSPSYGGAIQTNMQIWGPSIKGLLIQATHMGYVYNTTSTESFPNSLYFNSYAHTFLRKNKQATKKHRAKDESKTKNRSKEKQKREIHSPCTEEGAVTPNPDLHALALVQAPLLQTSKVCGEQRAEGETVPNGILSEPCSATRATSFTYLTEQCILSKGPLKRRCVFLKFSGQFEIKFSIKWDGYETDHPLQLQIYQS